MTTKAEEWKALGNLVSSHGGDGPIIAVVYGVDEATSDARARRIAAVPDMEAALMRLVECAPGIEASNWGGEEILEEARAALRKAGVL